MFEKLQSIEKTYLNLQQKMYDPAIALNQLEDALLNGQKLELGILNNRRNYHLHHANKEVDRINMIEKRLNN